MLATATASITVVVSTIVENRDKEMKKRPLPLKSLLWSVINDFIVREKPRISS